MLSRGRRPGPPRGKPGACGRRPGPPRGKLRACGRRGIRRSGALRAVLVGLAAVLLVVLGSGPPALGAALHAERLLQALQLTARSGAAGDHFGFSVAVSANGSTIVVGAPSATIAGHRGQGAAYVFVRRGGGWSAANMVELTAPDGGAGDQLGISVALSANGSTVVVGAQGATLRGEPRRGTAYVFLRPLRGWLSGGGGRGLPGAIRLALPAAKLIAAGGHAGDLFGTSVGVSGDGGTIIVGADGTTVGQNLQQGAAYMFLRPRRGWGTGHQPRRQVARLTATDGVQSDFLGYSVAISRDGSTVLVGAPFAGTPSVGGQGAAYVFVRPAGGWTSGTQTARLSASNGIPGDALGVSVAISNDGSTLVAGACCTAVSGHAGQGGAYVFARPTGGWSSSTETAELTASDGAADDDLGSSVAISGDARMIAAGAIGASVKGKAHQGAVYVFAKPASGWASGTERTKLTVARGTAREYFGSSLAVSGVANEVVAGAPFATLAGHRAQGAAYVLLAGGGRRSARAARQALITITSS